MIAAPLHTDRRTIVSQSAFPSQPIDMVPHLAGCPYAAYAHLREQGGVHQAVKPSGGQVWVISRYADVKALLCDPRMSVDDLEPLPQSADGLFLLLVAL